MATRPRERTIRVCYGTNGNNLPSKQTVVQLYKNRGVKGMLVYAEDPTEILDAIISENANEIELVLGIPNSLLPAFAAGPAKAEQWVNKYLNKYNSINFKYIAVGDLTELSQPDIPKVLGKVLPSMKNVRDAIPGREVTTAIGTSLLHFDGFPSKCSFHHDFEKKIKEIVDELVDWRSPLLVRVQPYIIYRDSSARTPNNSRDYALFESRTEPLQDKISATGKTLEYYNLFDAILDGFYCAIEKAAGGDKKIELVAISGWPSAGAPSANAKDAEIYNNNLIDHVNRSHGTPKKRDNPIETYVSAMFDENLREGPDFQKHWGLCTADGSPKYPFFN